MTQEKILEGVQDLLACAHKVLAGQSVPSTTRRLLPPPQDDDRVPDEED